MEAIDSPQLLRAGLLEGVSIALARAASPLGSTLANVVNASCSELGARVSQLELAVGGEDPAQQDADVERAVERVLTEAGEVDLLVVDCAGLLAAETPGERALMACMEAAWCVTHAVVGSGFMGRQRGGRIVYLAPAPDRGEHAGAVCSGLENLARTLSIEWARHAITTVTVAPGERTTDGELAALVGYLASPAGAYFSGCLLDLRGVGGG
jgi:NAD(P)-dependent dehydrogenase (short-subunit alcohol dehydrogenase family)